jgi:hypothetical protein
MWLNFGWLFISRWVGLTNHTLSEQDGGIQAVQLLRTLSREGLSGKSN